jgi:hypothetical protein
MQHIRLRTGGSLDELVLSQFHILDANPYLRTRIILNIARGSFLSCVVHHYPSIFVRQARLQLITNPEVARHRNVLPA